MNHALAIQGLKKHFGSVKANDGIDITVGQGEIHAICGENGAGKSTLVKQLGGLLRPDEGEIRLYGKKVEFGSAKEAIDKGVGILHQHFMLVEAFTALENILLGAEPQALLRLKKKQGREAVRDICRSYRLDLDLNAEVSKLSVGVQQRIEIVKILYKRARIIVLDEPTAVLTPQETESLFAIMRDLKRDGCSVVFISHKLKEVLEVADRVTVIRDGRSIGTWNIGEVDERSLASSMVGRDVLLEAAKEPEADAGKPILELREMTVRTKPFEQGVDGVSLTIREGEIFGIIGIAGNGQEALVEGILGIRKMTGGQLMLDGVERTNRLPTDFRRLSIGFIASDRLKEGLITEFSVRDNAYLGYHRSRLLRKGMFLSAGRIREWTRGIVEGYRVKTPSDEARMTSLSGGNQQKLIIGRELVTQPKLIVAVQPTRGVDIGSIEYIYENLLRQRKRGAAVLLVSQELEEVLSLSDRIGVLCGGRLIGFGKPSDFTKEQIGLMMAGISADNEKEGRAHG